MGYATKEQLMEILSDMAQKIKVPVVGLGGGFAPVGTINFFDAIAAPEGWLVCDGGVYNISNYPALAYWYETQHGSKNFYGGDGVTTFAVPDLQGEFLRGAGTNSHANQGSGGSVGDHQDATEIPEPVSNVTNLWVGVRVNSTGGDQFVTKEDSSYNAENTGVITTPKGNLNSSSWTNVYPNYYTSRPTNTSFLICVKAVVSTPSEGGQSYMAGEGIDITGDLLSIDPMPSSDMSEVLDPLPMVQARRMVYSTDEQVVGTWIDGKPLYQRTISFIGSVNSVIANVSDLHISQMVAMFGIGYENPAFYSFPSSFVNPRFNVSTGDIIIQSSESTTWNFTAGSYLTLQYTKTTD